MRACSKLLSVTCSFLIALVFNFHADSAEIKVLSSIAMKEILHEIGPHFEQKTGHKLTIKYDTSKGLVKLIEEGEAFDATLLTDGIVESLSKRGVLDGDTRRNVARTGLGIAIRAGAARPDISTPDGFKAVLLKAASIGSSETGMAGVVFMRVLKELGIESEVKPKIKLVKQGYVAEIVATGEAELAVHLISEILPVRGTELLGPFPPQFQEYIVITGAVAKKSQTRVAAQAFVQYFKEPVAVIVTTKKGMEPMIDGIK